MVAVHRMPVDVRITDGVADAYLAYPDDGAPHPGVLVIQDGFTQADTSAHDPVAADRHYRELLALFDRTLPVGRSPGVSENSVSGDGSVVG